MALSTEQFERIVGKVELSTTAEQTHRVMLPDGTFTLERRQEARFRFGQRAKIRLERPDHVEVWNTVMLQDISLNGISFLCDQELPLESRLRLALKDQAGELTTIRCIVRRCEPGGFGRTSFTVGAKFQQVITEEAKPGTEAGAESAVVEEVSDPFAITEEAAPTEEQAGTRMNVIHRAANILNPARLWSYLKRDYDDFSAPGSGSTLPKGMLNKIAETMESFPTPSPHAPKMPSEQVVPSGQSSALPRRSSIFLYEEAPPVSETPAKTDLAPVIEAPPVAAAAANETPPPIDVEEYARWAKRDLSDKKYVYMWAGELNVGAPSGEGRIMALLGASENGQTELIALQSASPSTSASWKRLLLNLMRRGLIKPPKLAIADRSLAFWPALADFARGTSKQYSWHHEITHVLNLLPKGMQRLAQKELKRIQGLSKREEATQAIDLLVQDFQADAPQAAQNLQQEKERLLTFYDFPAEHWPALRDSSVVEMMFNRNGPIKRDESLLMDETLSALLKIAQAAEANWPALPESQRLVDLMHGEQFIDGVKEAA